MATIRRILMAVVGLLLIVDAGALAYVKFTSGPKPSEETSKLVIWIDNGEKAKSAVEILKGQGYEALIKPDKRKTEEEADFRVAMSASRKELLTPIAEVLRQGGHRELSYSEDGTKLYYGGFFKQKAQAVRTAERIKAKEKVGFEVVPGTRIVTKQSHKVILMAVPSNMVTELITSVESQKIEIADQVETPNEAAGDE